MVIHIKKKFIAFVIIVLILAATTTACKHIDEEDEFINYLIENYGSSEEDKKDQIELPSGNLFNANFIFVDSEKSSYNKRIVMNLYGMDQEWFLDKDKYRQDMEFICDKFIDYANDSHFNNDYYLYLKIGLPSTSMCDLVYNYESNNLYIPKKMDEYLYLYHEFSTFYLKDIAEMEGGEDYLIEHNIATIVHKNLEIDHDWISSYTVYIYDGEFNESGIGESDMVH